MNSRNDKSLDHDEVVELLPWFANGTLESSESAMVSRHVETCEECQQELQFLSSLNDTVQDDARMNVSEHADVELNLSAVLDRIDSAGHQRSVSSASLSSISRRVIRYLESLSLFPGLRWAGAALACGLVVALGLQFNTNRATDDYTVLSSSNEDRASMRLFVHFLPGTEETEAQAIVDSALRQIEGEENAVMTPSDDTISIIFTGDMQAGALSTLMNDLENHSLIERVEFGTVP